MRVTSVEEMRPEILGSRSLRARKGLNPLNRCGDTGAAGRRLAASVLSGLAEDALSAEMFSPDQRKGINGWRLGLQESGRLVAPLAGAGLFAVAGGGVVALLDAATFPFTESSRGGR